MRIWFMLARRLGPTLACGMFALRAMAVDLPITSTFDTDTPGQPPVTGGPNQPTGIVVPSGGSILVQSAANGIDTQPVELFDGGSTDFTNLDYSFPGVSSQILRVEATVAFDHFVSGYFLQTRGGLHPGTSVVTRLRMGSNGSITNDADGTLLGTYEPNTPFRSAHGY